MSSKDTYLGIEIGGTKLQLSIVDCSGNIEQNVRYAVDPKGGAEDILHQIISGLQKFSFYDNITAAGVGFGGPVNRKTGAVHVSHQVSGWAGFKLSDWLQEIIKKPVVIENDANVAALAEAVYGCGKGFERIFYMTIGSGIGGGVIINENIYHGRVPGEVEIGHIRLNKSGITLESTCSGWAVNKKISDYIHKNPASLFAQMAANNSAPKATLLKPAVEAGDEAAKIIIAEIADDISFSLSHVVHFFHPDVIIIGGGLSLLGEHLRMPVAQKLPDYIMKAFLPIPPIKIASLGESVVPLGAAELAKNICTAKN